MPQDHVLLIGIDAYDGVPSLGGCVNDIDAIQRILVDRVGIHPSRITRLASPHLDEEHEIDVAEQPATLANIRAALARLGSEEVAPGDRVLIHYSGHGTQAKLVEQSGTSYVREALIPQDAVVELVVRQFLFDWELNGLLAAIAARTSAVSFVLDSCCSAGATRGRLTAAGRASRARYVRTREPVILTEPLSAPSQRRGLASTIAGTVATCQVVAACLGDERARESDDEHAIRHGELTRAFVDQLASIPDEALAELRWGRIWPQILAAVHAANPAQHPWISGGSARRVFGGPPEDGDMGYGVTRDGDEYRLTVGSLLGVTKGAELGVYGSEPARLPPVGSPADETLRRLIRVIDAGPSSARAVALEAPFDPPPGARVRLVTAGEAARLRVSISPPDEAVARRLRASTLVELVGESETSDLELVQRSDGAWALLDDVFDLGDAPGEPWLVRVPADRLMAIRRIVEHYYRYSQPIRLAKLCQDLPHALRISLHDARDAANAAPAEGQEPDRWPELPRGEDAPYVLTTGESAATATKACFIVRNGSTSDLHVSLLYCNNSGTVSMISHEPKPILAGGAHVFWSRETLMNPFPVTRLRGRATSVDRIVAIGTTHRNTQLPLLEQTVTFAGILQASRGTGVRGGSAERRSAPAPELWTSDVTAVRLVTPDS